MPRTALALYGSFVLVAVVFRAALQRWRIGSFGIRLPARRRAPLEWAVTAVFAGSSCIVGVLAPVAQRNGIAVPLAGLDTSAWHGLGIASFALGLGACVLSQLWMGASWRVGVDPAESTALVTSGPFRVVRNPIYTATALAMLGLAMLAPNPLGVLGIIVLFGAVAIQVRAIEEPHLLAAHGDAYASYAARTGRFLPMFGRIEAVRTTPANDARAIRVEPARTTSAERWHALDALRAMAMLWVIVGHAFLAYMDTRYGRLWAVYDRAPSELLSVAFWWIHGFRLPLFFLLSGLFSARLYAARGPSAFLRQRSKRIAIPFVVGAVVLLPIIYYVFALGWWLSGECTWNEIRRVRFAPHIQTDVYGPVHLWFLEYLYLYCVLFWAYRLLAARAERGVRRPFRLERALGSVWRPFVCALPTTALLLVDPGVATTHRNTFVPVPLELVYYGVFFAIGAACFRLTDNLPRLRSGSALHLAASLPLFWLATYPLVRAEVAGGLAPGGRLALALSLALYAWLSVFGWIGVFQTLLARPHPRLAYLADAAYWIYLVHLPLVAALQIALARLALPVELKCAVVVAGTLWVCLRSYDRWVRYTFIGAMLNGRRSPATTTSAVAVAPLPALRTADG